MFSTLFNPKKIEAQLEFSKNCTDAQVQKVVSKFSFTISDLPILLSPQAEKYIEILAQKSQQLTLQRFGKTMQVFVPMYISNVCYNSCTYCGFSMENEYPRITLSYDEILKEAHHLHKRGFQHILLLTGEAEKSSVDYILKAVELISPLFASVGIEIQPLSTQQYQQMLASGCDSLTVYQETYHPEAYAKYHKAGKKKNFEYRLDTPDRGGEAGFYKINIGALMGLHDWRYEAFALAEHLLYLQKKYWKTKYAVSFPRIKDEVGGFKPQTPVRDLNLVQLVCAFRLVFPDLGITLSTREPADLRDAIFPLGITTISAESKTSPGAYTLYKDTEPQFDISDERPLEAVKASLENLGYEPVLKDWDKEFVHTFS